MLELSEIAKEYPEKLRGFSSFIIREYLQFLGGTCLRIVHGKLLPPDIKVTTTTQQERMSPPL